MALIKIFYTIWFTMQNRQMQATRSHSTYFSFRNGATTCCAWLILLGLLSPAEAVVPLTIDFSDGYTFSGVSRSTETDAVGNVIFSYVQPFEYPAFSDDGKYVLSSNRNVTIEYPTCDPAAQITSEGVTTTNGLKLQYMADNSLTPGAVKEVNVVIPSFDENPNPPFTSLFPISELNVSVTITYNGQTVSGALEPAAPPPGALANYLVTFPVPFPLDGTAQVEVSFTGEVSPTLGTPTVTSICSTPTGQTLPSTSADGINQLFLQNPFVILFIEEDEPPPPPVVILSPQNVTVAANSTQAFDAYSCPVDTNGSPAVGLDGVPGTDDDGCTPVTADWSTSGGIGTVSPLAGSSTTLTAASVVAGQTRSGTVIARVGADIVFSNVLVEGPNDPTHEINLEVERMFRQGLPVADDVTAGDTQIVVRPTTAHELDESLGTMVVGGTVLPFDARASLLGELATCERTIVVVSPADLGLMRQGILDDIDASGRDSTDLREVARFLRRNPDRGRVTLTLDAEVERDLLASENAYVGNLSTGFIGLREDLLLREAQVERIVSKNGEERRIQIRVNLVENDAVTNVLPYDDSLSSREVNRLRRSPSDGGIFQGADEPRNAQLIAVHNGRGEDEGSTNTRDSAIISTGKVGENTERSAHAFAHLVGHLLFGRQDDNDDLLSIMHNDPANAAGAGDEFYTDNFDDFEYSDRTVRRGLGHLDRYWRR